MPEFVVFPTVARFGSLALRAFSDFLYLDTVVSESLFESVGKLG